MADQRGRRFLFCIASMCHVIYRTCNAIENFACDSPIFCHGNLLDAVQRSKIFPDDKTFVDMHLRKPEDEVLKDFQIIESRGNLNASVLEEFVKSHFDKRSGLDSWIPPDWTESPSIVAKIKDSRLKTFALDLNKLWKQLGKKVKTEVREQPNLSSLLYVPNGFIIPGERFRESYYWDSYWILGGLLLSDMTATARGMIENLLGFVEKYGHVPNGGRIYYINRSQPPFLTQMMALYHKYTRDLDFVKKNIAILEKESEFWNSQRMVIVTSPGNGRLHKMAHYAVNLETPRPEGYSKDAELTENMSKETAAITLSNVASACESGWDFSSRWFGDMKELSTIKTQTIIPVDLNAYLCLNDKILADFHASLGNGKKHQMYSQRVEDRKQAIHDVLWSEDEGVWFDFDTEKRSPRKNFYPSNVFPLYAECSMYDFSNETNVQKILTYLYKQNLTTFRGGIPTSMIPTGQQWDMPNAWPPLVHLLIQSIASIPNKEAEHLAKNLTSIWIQSNLEGFETLGQMFEKYDAKHYGKPGGGGEYKVQTGFGWTNGVALMLLDKFPDLELPTVPRVPTELIAVLLVTAFLAGVFLVATYFYIRRRRKKQIPPYALVRT